MNDISLVIPIYNEAFTIAELIYSIKNQSIQPDEIILVDGGSQDNTVEILNSLIAGNPKFRLISVPRAMPGEGRNIGVAEATSNWIAFTDGGIRLNSNWLEELVAIRDQHPAAEIIYGNVAPILDTFFVTCAAVSYVNPLQSGSISHKFIASSLLRKEVWKKAGGFPAWRAAEDLIFMERAEKNAQAVAYAPKAWVYWEIRKDLRSTFKKFYLYSAYNVWAGRQDDWHYGIARQYFLALLAMLAAVFYNGFFWLFFPAWFFARALKRAIMNRQILGNSVFDPRVLFMVMLILFTIDMATFSGWIKAILHPNAIRRSTFR